MIKMKLENQTPTCVISHLKLIISQINLICRGLNVVNYNVLCLFLWASINYQNKYLPPTQKEVEGKKGGFNVFASLLEVSCVSAEPYIGHA